MKDSLKISLLTIMTIVLMLLNGALLAFFWLGPLHLPPDDRPAGGDRAQRLVHELNLDAAQQKEYAKLRAEHQEMMMTIGKNDRRLHDALFERIETGRDSDAVSDSLIGLIAGNRKQTELATFHHLSALRKLCTPAQQKRFDEIVKDFFAARPENRPPGRP